MGHARICVACAYYGVMPASLAVDHSSRSTDEADALCTLHRARCTEGYCVLCGRRAPWMSPFPKSDVGCCQLCYMVLYGVEAAEALEASWGDQAA
jgi:hypothetical protein